MKSNLATKGTLDRSSMCEKIMLDKKRRLKHYFFHKVAMLVPLCLYIHLCSCSKNSAFAVRLLVNKEEIMHLSQSSYCQVLESHRGSHKV